MRVYTLISIATRKSSLVTSINLPERASLEANATEWTIISILPNFSSYLFTRLSISSSFDKSHSSTNVEPNSSAIDFILFS